MKVLKLNIVKNLRKFVASGLILCSIFTNAGVGLAIESYYTDEQYSYNNGNHVPNQTSLEVDLDFTAGNVEWGLEHTGSASPETIMVNEISKVNFPVKIKKLDTAVVGGKVDVTVTGEYTAKINSIELVLQKRLNNQWVDIPIPKLIISNSTEILSHATKTFGFNFSGINLETIDDDHLRGVVLVDLENRGGENQDESYHNREDLTISQNQDAILKFSNLTAANGLQLSNIKIYHDNNAISLPQSVKDGDTYIIRADAKGLIKGIHDVSNDVQLFYNNTKTINSSRTVTITCLENTDGSITPPDIVVTPPDIVVTPSDIITTPPDIITTPPDIITTPPDIVTTPPDIVTTPPDIITTPPVIVVPPDDGTTPTTGGGGTPPKDDTKNGGVTPPPSEKVTPPIIKITPVRVPAGDPTITLKAFEQLKEAYAILPGGKKIKLTYNKTTKVWKGFFLVPFGTKNGPYKIKIFTKNRKNIVKKYYYTITIDNSLPLIKASIKNKKRKLSINANVLFPASKVYIKINGKTYRLNKKGTFRWDKNIYLPSYKKSKTYLVTIIATDKQGHKGKIIFKYRLK